MAGFVDKHGGRCRCEDSPALTDADTCVFRRHLSVFPEAYESKVLDKGDL
jgi:hypothetical protein